MPAAGEIALFDRSWYNRAGVEKVMGFCTPDQTQDFLNAAPEFERHLVDDGMLLFKYWLCCDQAVQEERFQNRLNNPMKRWKLSPIDIKAREHYDDYTEARELMLAATHTDFAPWTLVDFNDQPLGRLTLLRDLLDRVPGHRAAARRDRLAAARRMSRSRSVTACCSRSRHIRSHGTGMTGRADHSKSIEQSTASRRGAALRRGTECVQASC